MAVVTLAALGVVFGDIGTSPLYALQAVFHVDHGAVPTRPPAIYGVLSLVFWSVTIIVSIKYLTFIMRADNDGEGGIMALIALIQRAGPAEPLGADRAHRARHLRRRPVLRRRDDHAGDLGALGGRGPGGRVALAGVAGRAHRARRSSPRCSPIQRFGTGAVGRALRAGDGAVVRGPRGRRHRADRRGIPAILRALSPSYAVAVLRRARRRRRSSRSASVVLAVTGAEALYADMGHFGRAADPPRVVLPRLPRADRSTTSARAP